MAARCLAGLGELMASSKVDYFRPRDLDESKVSSTALWMGGLKVGWMESKDESLDALKASCWDALSKGDCWAGSTVAKYLRMDEKSRGDLSKVGCSVSTAASK